MQDERRMNMNEETKTESNNIMKTKIEKIEDSIHSIREKYGKNSLKRGTVIKK